MAAPIVAPRSGARPAKRVLLIGWDGADWAFIEPLIARGLMPTLAALRQKAAWGNLATLHPPLSPMLWTSIATGKRPTKHGILGFTEPSPDGHGARPSASTSRRVKAVWNILSQAGLRSNVVGWCASHPAEPVAGVVVAERFEMPVAPVDQPWPIPADAVYPRELAGTLAALRVHPAELDAGALIPFVPRAGEVANDPRLGTLAGLLAQTASVQSIATHLLETTEWDFTAVYFEGLDRFGHHFMQLRPPALPEVPTRDVEIFGEVMTGCYRFHDMMLARLLELAGPGTTVLLVSDHGYHHDARRPALEEGPLAWHRDLGIAVAAGPGIREVQRLFGANVLDVAPTILSLFGLPVGADMDGRPWSEIILAESPRPIASWETVEGNAGRHEGAGSDPMAAAEVIRQFVALGYVEPLSTDEEEAAHRTASQNKLHLALAHLDARESKQAVAILEPLCQQTPDDPHLKLHLAVAHAAAGDGEAAERLALPLAESAEPQPRSWLLLSRIAAARGQHEKAAEWLRRLEECSPDDPSLKILAGQQHLLAGRFDHAQRLFQRIVTEDHESAAGHDGLAAALLGLGQPSGALESALRGVELRHFLPRGHFHVGEALIALGEDERACTALSICLGQAPGHVRARELLAAAQRRLGRVEAAEGTESFLTFLAAASRTAPKSESTIT